MKKILLVLLLFISSFIITNSYFNGEDYNFLEDYFLNYNNFNISEKKIKDEIFLLIIEKEILESNLKVIKDEIIIIDEKIELLESR